MFDYAQVLFAAILGFLFLSQIPDWWSAAGYVIIIGAAVGRWLYELKRPAPLPVETETAEQAPPQDENSADDG